MEKAPVNLMNYDAQGLAGYFRELGETSFRATQIVKWIHQHGITNFGEMTNLSKKLREQLSQETEIRVPSIGAEQISEDGTRKWLVNIDAINSVETVYIPEGSRGTLCVSSQVGCPLNCQFCATATQGFNRNLSVSEIIGQVWLASKKLYESSNTKRSITNVVMMGMGEPLLNFNNTVMAMKLMMDNNAYNLGKKRITLSTAGIVPGIDKLAEACPVSLAISLHATNNHLRDKLVPLNKKYPIEKLLQTCKSYSRATNDNHITFEYVMLKDVNDSVKEASVLIKLLDGIPAKVNLIPFNPYKNSSFERSEERAINNFRDKLYKAGIITITRKTRGSDIDAACGQLVGQVEKRRKTIQNTH